MPEALTFLRKEIQIRAQVNVTQLSEVEALGTPPHSYLAPQNVPDLGNPKIPGVAWEPSSTDEGFDLQRGEPLPGGRGGGPGRQLSEDKVLWALLQRLILELRGLY